MGNTIEDAMTELFNDVTFETLIAWADLLKIEHDEENWLDDEWTEKEDALRQRLTEFATTVLEEGSTT